MTIYVVLDCILERSIDIYIRGDIRDNILKVMLVIIWMKVYCKKYWLLYLFGICMQWIGSMTDYIEHLYPWMYIENFFLGPFRFWELIVICIHRYWTCILPKLKLYVLGRSYNLSIIQSYIELIENKIYARYIQQVLLNMP